jgi:hypothetical protein
VELCTLEGYVVVRVASVTIGEESKLGESVTSSLANNGMPPFPVIKLIRILYSKILHICLRGGANKYDEAVDSVHKAR